MFKKFLGPAKSIGFAAGLVAFFSILSRVIGVLRDRILAGQFGAGNELDAYYAAFRVPDLIFNLVVLGALSAGFIPIFTRLLEKQNGEACEIIYHGSHSEAWRFAANVLNILLFALIILSIIGAIFSPTLISIVAPGFDAEKSKLSADMMRIMFLSPIFLGVSGVFGGILQSFRQFFVYSLAPIVYNLGIIAGALIFARFWGIYGVALGVACGAFLHALIQVTTVFRMGFRYRLFFDFSDPYIKQLGRMTVARVMSLAASQFNLFFITIIASSLAAGSLAVFNLANNLQYFPIGVFGIAFAVAAFPSLSLASSDYEKAIQIFSRVFRKILLFIVPSTVLLLVLRAQIIRIILGTGKFSWDDTILTMNTLGFFALSLFAQATIPLLARMYFAFHDSRTPFFAAITSVVVNIFLAFPLSEKFGAPGLALAFSISSIINFAVLWIIWRIKNGHLDEDTVIPAAIRFSAAAVVCGLAAQGVKTWIGLLVNMETFFGVLTQLTFSSLVALIIYGVALKLFKSEELSEVLAKIKIR